MKLYSYLNIETDHSKVTFKIMELLYSIRVLSALEHKKIRITGMGNGHIVTINYTK